MDVNQLSEFQKRFVTALETMVCTGICCYMNNFYQEWYYASNQQRQQIRELCDGNHRIFDNDVNWSFRVMDWQEVNQEMMNNIHVDFNA